MIERTATIATPVLDAGPVDNPPPAAAAPAHIASFGLPAAMAAAILTLVGTPATPGSRFEVSAPNIARDPLRGFRNVGEFAVAVRNAGRLGSPPDARLVHGGLISGPGSFQAAATGYMQESNAPEGAMVPPAFSQAIWQLVFADPLLDLLTVEPTDSNAVDILRDETTPWGATGVQASWRAEGVQMSASKLATLASQVRVHELYAFVLATQELLDDAPRLNDRLAVKAPAAIRWKLVEAFMFGHGAGQPLGWANAAYPGSVVVTRTTATQVKPDDFVNMFARLLVADGPDRSFWVVNRDTLPDIILKSVVGNIPVWMPPSGLAGAPQGSILGRPLFYSEHCQTKGTKGDVQYVNPDGYYALQRGPARYDTSIHLFFDQNVTAFRWMFRFGGQPLLSAAVSPAKGSNTKSHFVILNT
jgi:HK97 family phage major capsid protein